MLLKTEAGYQAYPLARDVGSMRPTCREGTTITQSETLGGERKEHTVPGATIEQKQAEGASAANYWIGTGFTEVGTSD